MRLEQGRRPSSRRPARTSRASASGARFGTGGSRGIRTSEDYVRRGGAAARMMLLQAAANEWKVPVERAHGEQRRHHARADRAHDDLRQGRRQPRPS